MNFQTAVRTVFLQKYATFGGRACRSEYWWWILALLIGSLATTFVDVAFFASEVETDAGPGSFSLEHDGPLTTIFYLAMIVPNLAVSVRRLHDLDKSGWWLLIMLIPLIGSLYLLFLFVQRGTEGSNHYGPDPLGGDKSMEAEDRNISMREQTEALTDPELDSGQAPPPVTDGEQDPIPQKESERPSWRTPSTKGGFQTTQDRFKGK